MSGLSLFQKGFTESVNTSNRTIPLDRQIDDVERLHAIAVTMAGTDGELRSLVLRLAVFTDMEQNYNGDTLGWRRRFQDETLAYHHEYRLMAESLTSDCHHPTF